MASIRVTMILVVLATLLPMLGLVLYEAVDERARESHQIEEELAARVSIASIEEERTIERTRALLAALAKEPDVAGPGCDEILARVRSQAPHYATVGRADAEGRIVCNAAGSANGSISIADRLYFQRAMETRDFAIGEYQIGRTTGVATINFGYPLVDNETVTGVLFAALNLSTLQGEEFLARLPAGSRLTLIDGDGRILYRHPDPEGLSGARSPPGEIIDIVLAKREGTSRSIGLDGVPRFYAFREIGVDVQVPVFMALGVPEAAVLAEANATLGRALVTALVVGVLALGGTFLVVERAIVKPTRGLEQTARRLREGDFTARTGVSASAGGELASLARSFDATAASLEAATAARAAHAEELRRSEARYRLLIEGAKEYAIFLLDAEGRIQTWNGGAQRLKGYTADEAIGQHFGIFFTPEDRAAGRPQAVLESAARKGTHEESGVRIRKDGTRFFVSSLVTPLRSDEGELLGFTKLTRDITEQRRAHEAEAAREAAEATSRAKSEFLANMSHEIRTPLNAVIGMSSLLLDTELTEEQREMALIARTSGEHLLTLINDILDFSKIEAGKMELDVDDMVVGEVVEQALDVVTSAANGKELELAAEVGDAVPHAIVADAARLRQVLVNLLANAIKFTERGEVSVRVDATPAPEGEWELTFCISDTGIGIAPEKLAKLFQPFTQGDASTSRTHGGTGLGLAISRRLAEAMGGRIWAQSDPGAGSRFSFTIRARPSGTAPLAATPAHLSGRSVLIVDDNATNRRILTHQMAKWGLRPTAIASPVESLERIRAGARFDVAILDFHMPEMDGATLGAELQRLVPGMPLVLLSSLSSWLAESESRGVRFLSVLTKPAKASQLFDAISTAIGAADSPDEPAADAPRSRRELRILLVEDNVVNQRVATLMLKALGYGADVVADGAQGVERALAHEYDVILMDIQMPIMDGFEATRRIRHAMAPERQPRIIALTAHALETEREKAYAAGMDDYVTKPLDRGALAAALERARASREARG